jgi:hypothetical protein
MSGNKTMHTSCRLPLLLSIKHTHIHIVYIGVSIEVVVMDSTYPLPLNRQN